MAAMLRLRWQTTWNINDVYGVSTNNERTVRFWFARFRGGNFNLANEPRERPSLVDGLKWIMSCELLLKTVHRKL